ncbi:MAG: hypothetical protein V3T43_06110 [Nitrosomonadaceae bacterium]
MVGLTKAKFTDQDARTVDATHQYGSITPGNSAATPNSYGILQGITATDASATVAPNARGISFEQTSTATTGSQTGIFTNSDRSGAQFLPFMAYTFEMGQVTTVRLFVGLTDSGSLAGMSNSDDPSAEYIGIGFSTDRGDTKLQLVEDNGTTQTLTDTGIVATTDTIYQLLIDFLTTTSALVTILDNSGDVLFQKLLNTTLPAAATPIRPMLAYEPRDNVARVVGTFNVYLQNRSFGRGNKV